MTKQTAKWIAEVTVLIGVLGFVARSAVRLNKMESETEKVNGMEYQIRVINITLKLLAPQTHQKAEELAK